MEGLTVDGAPSPLRRNGEVGMEKRTTGGILLLADISGFTKFVRDHARSASHARQVTARLLRAIISASGPPLEVAELEGDAVFFFSLGAEDELLEVSKQVELQIPRFFRAFANEIKVLSSKPRCHCRACESIGELRLKVVVHAGEVALERIDRFEKLFGIDVIVVHRMLKNSVDAREYVMISEPAFSTFGGFFGLEPERRIEKLDGVGELGVMVFSRAQLAALQDELDKEEGPVPDPALLKVLRSKLGVQIHTLVDFVIGRN